MLFLGLESSCDETAVALLESQSCGTIKIIAEEISSQNDIHQLYGGVVPELASRQHLRNFPILLEAVLKSSNTDLKEITAIGVTQGPGLLGCLLVGLNFAKGLSLGSNIPLYGINHIEGHILSAMLDCPELTFPYLALIVSGGHTEIINVKGLADYQVLARTIDDAAGEAFDKSANLLGFEYPGAVKLANMADTFRQAGKSSAFKLPKVMQGSADFSFSGLKTAIALLVKKNSAALQADPELRAALAHTIQEAILENLINKLDLAQKATGVSNIAVVGGVSANKRLRELLALKTNSRVFFPAMSHCMDNAAMIAFCTARRYLAGYKPESKQSAISRWPVELLQA